MYVLELLNLHLCQSLNSGNQPIEIPHLIRTGQHLLTRKEINRQLISPSDHIRTQPKIRIDDGAACRVDTRVADEFGLSTSIPRVRCLSLVGGLMVRTLGIVPFLSPDLCGADTVRFKAMPKCPSRDSRRSRGISDRRNRADSGTAVW